MGVPTTSGRAPQITVEWFRTRYGQNFDILTDDKEEMLKTCIDDVYALFYGVGELWSHLERSVYVNKTQLCYGLLVAWYIADLFPELTSGVMSMGGGVPLRAKKIGGTMLQFGDVASKAGGIHNADLLQSLKTNAFGALKVSHTDLVYVTRLKAQQWNSPWNVCVRKEKHRHMISLCSSITASL